LARSKNVKWNDLDKELRFTFSVSDLINDCLYFFSVFSCGNVNVLAEQMLIDKNLERTGAENQDRGAETKSTIRNRFRQRLQSLSGGSIPVTFQGSFGRQRLSGRRLPGRSVDLLLQDRKAIWPRFSGSDLALPNLGEDKNEHRCAICAKEMCDSFSTLLVLATLCPSNK